MEVSSYSLQEDFYINSFFQETETPFMPPNDVTKKRPYEDLYGAGEDFLTEFLSFEPEKQETEYYSAKRARSDYKTEHSHSAASPFSEESNGNDGATPQRRLWVKDRSSAWWERASSPDFPETEFKKAFRMSRATFDFICRELEPAITKKDTMLRSAIPVPRRVAVCVWRLATGEALRAVSARFGLGISTCHKLVLEVCNAIRTVLMPKFLRWPADEEKIAAVKKGFETLSGIPNIGGVIYTTHVPIIAPKQNPAAYFNKRQTERNQKTSYSVAVQGVVDCRGAFTDISLGWPGALTDEQVLEKSSLFQRAGKGALKNGYLLGGASFPLMDWLMVPYPRRQGLTWAKNSYNKNVEEVSKVVARGAFMRLKARWSCLQKRTEMKLEDLPAVLAACCVLHNICEESDEGLSEDLRFELFDDENFPENSERSVNAKNERDQIAHRLLHHEHSGTIVV